MKLKYFLSVLFLAFNYFSFGHAATFNNYFELSKCVDYYNSFGDYKSKLKDCFAEQGLKIDNKTLGVIKNKSRDFDYGAIDKIFNLENSSIDKIRVTDKNIKQINQYIKLNPQDIFVLTEDINILTYKNSLLLEFQRQELLLNLYNSFEPIVLTKIAEVSPPEKLPGIDTRGIALLGGAGLLALGGGGGGGGGDGSSSSGTATLSYAVSSKTVSECGNAVTITGNLTKAHSSNVTITYTVSGTATNSVDYNLSSTTSTIVAGSTSGSITLTPVNDTTNETSETVIISASTTDIATTGNTSTTITIYDYVIRCNSTAFTDQGTSSTMAARDEFENVDASSASTKIHPFELLNIHKAHAFNDGTNDLDGTGITIHVHDFNIDENHTEFSGKTISKYGTFAADSSADHHGNLVAGIAAGNFNNTSGSTGIMGVAYNSDLVFSPVDSSGSPIGSRKFQHNADSWDHARTNGATVSNNSWGSWRDNSPSDPNSGVNVTEMSTIISNNSGSQSQDVTMASYLWGGNATLNNSLVNGDWTNMIQALDDFQTAGGVILFATGNSTMESDVSVYAGLPQFYSQLAEAYLAVGWVDVTGVSSRSSITSSNVTQLGNVCGSAADYCLVTDSKDIQGATWFNNSTSASNYANTSLGGSSSATPMVSGIVALLQQAFPNHTNEAIVDRILASAKNDWFTATGETTFTTHGASIKHGYHSTWGHGFPDAYAALSPITTSSNPLSFGGGGGGGGGSGGGGSGSGGSIPFSALTKIPVQSTAIFTSSSIGDSIFNGLENKSIYAYDALNGGFKFNISDFIYYDKIYEQKIELSLKDELNILRGFNFEEIILNEKYQSPKISNEYIKIGSELGNNFSITLDNNNIALQNFNLYNLKSYKNPFTTENYGVGFNGNLDLFGSELLIGYNNSEFNPLTNLNKNIILPIETLALSINLNNNYFDKLSFTSGLSKEKETFLLSKAEGAFKLGDNGTLSNFYGINMMKKINDNKSLYFSSMIGNSKMNNLENSILIKSTNMFSSSFEFGFEQINLFGNDKLNISLSQPNRTESGELSFRLLGLSDKNGILPYTDYIVDVSPSGRQKDLTISYYKNFSDNFKIGVNTLFTDDIGHISKNDIDKNILLSAVVSF